MSDQKMAIITTAADEDTERAILPFVVGAAALASDVDVLIVPQSKAAGLAVGLLEADAQLSY